MLFKFTTGVAVVPGGFEIPKGSEQGDYSEMRPAATVRVQGGVQILNSHSTLAGVPDTRNNEAL